MTIGLNGSASTDSTRQVDSNSVQQTSAKTAPFAAKKPTTEDTTAFSSDTSAVSSLTQTALQTTPSRQARVESLKQAVSSAQYQLDADKIAASLANSDV